MNVISFPNISDTEFNVSSELTIGSYAFRWSGLIIAIGFALAIFYCVKRCAKFGILNDNLIDLVLISTPIAVIGARLYYVVFSFSEFKGDFVSVFKIWNGGIAVYGAIIFGLLAAFIYCRVKKLNTLNMFDLCVLGLLIGQCIGRWGDFLSTQGLGIESENLLWGMSVNEDTPVHPIFLYESLWTLIGFVVLHFASKKRRFYGQTFLLYILWYGLGRGLIEGLRGDDALMLFSTGIKASQALGYLSALAALGVLIYKVIFSERGDAICLLSGEEAAAFLESAQEERKNRKSGAAEDGEEEKQDTGDEAEPDEEPGEEEEGADGTDSDNNENKNRGE